VKTKPLIAAIAILPLLGAPVSAHLLDEYLQATLISIEKDHVQAAMRLVPGVAVSSFVLRSIDTNGDGVISQTEGRAYGERVLRDVSLKLDGHILRPQLISVEFPAAEEGAEGMKDGLGEIRIEFSAELPPGGPNRRLIFENRHQRGIAAYLVNCLVPRDRDIRVIAQNRDELQSSYQLDYVQAGVSAGLPDQRAWLALAALVLLARLAFLWRKLSPSARRRAS
jgi:hypothetical protein